MKNDHLHNKEKFDHLNYQKKSIVKKKDFKKPSITNVDINILLNKVKLGEKRKKKEKLILLSFVTIAISATGFLAII